MVKPIIESNHRFKIMSTLANKKVAILAENGFEESELTSPKEALEAAGALVHIVSPQKASIRSWKDGDWGALTLKVDRHIDDADATHYDAIVLPGGVLNPDKLRQNDRAVQFVVRFLESGKTVAAICHGPQTLIETGLLQGKEMTSYPSLRTDLLNAGVVWKDEAVVVDEGLVTSRGPADLPAFNQKLKAEIAEGVHKERQFVIRSF
jgi:protease I